MWVSSETKNAFKKIGKVLNYIGKIISTTLIILLVFIGIFLIYYVLSAKKLSKDPTYKPRINLYTIVSGSMVPAINVYDIIVDVNVSSPESIKPGDVITFKSTSAISQDLIVTHRVLDVRLVNGKYEYVTKGDWNPTADSDTAKYENIIGKVVFKIPQLGRIQFFLATKMGWFIIVLLPALGVIVYDVIKLLRLTKTKNKTESLVDNSNIEEYKKQEEEKQVSSVLDKINNSKNTDDIKDIDISKW